MMYINKKGKIIVYSYLDINCGDLVKFLIKVSGFNLYHNYSVRAVHSHTSLGEVISKHIVLMSDNGTERKFKSNDERFYKREF